MVAVVVVAVLMVLDVGCKSDDIGCGEKSDFVTDECNDDDSLPKASFFVLVGSPNEFINLGRRSSSAKNLRQTIVLFA